MDPEKIRERFWDMFIVDAFIGNWDRHNGNWGFLYHVQSDTLTLAPVFDCGSCLYPQADEKMIMKILADKRDHHDGPRYPLFRTMERKLITTNLFLRWTMRSVIEHCYEFYHG